MKYNLRVIFAIPRFFKKVDFIEYYGVELYDKLVMLRKADEAGQISMTTYTLSITKMQNIYVLIAEAKILHAFYMDCLLFLLKWKRN